MNKILCVIDMQNDFISGVLGTKHALQIVPNVIEKINTYKTNGDLIITTQDTHYDNYEISLESKYGIPKHCIANTDGWQLCDEVYIKLKHYNNHINVLKNTFGSVCLPQELKKYIPDDIEQQQKVYIEFIGLCLDICVISNILLTKAYFPNTKISVDANCTAASTPKMFKTTLDVLYTNQIEVQNV